MFIKNMKSILIITLLFVMSFVSISLYADCDMMAMIAKKGNSISWISGFEDNYVAPDDPHDLFLFLEHYSPSNPDGYGIIYINSEGNIPEIEYPDIIGSPTQLYDVSEQAWYVIPNVQNGNYTIPIYDGPYEDAKLKILNSDNDVSIVMGHVRNATGTTTGNHPFQIICDTNGDDEDETYMFMHNGNVTDMVSTFRTEILGIDNYWFDNNPSNWEGDSGSISGWIDSEMYFHYIIAHIKNANGDVVKGIYEALSNPAIYSGTTSINSGMLNNNVDANFVLTDGNNIYLYRNCDDDNHRLSYKKLSNGFTEVKTQHGSGVDMMPQNSFAVISQYNSTLIQFFLQQDGFQNIAFEKGSITDDLNYQNFSGLPRLFITGDCIIPFGYNIDITTGTYVDFINNATLTIEGTLNIRDNAELNLKHSSKILIDGTNQTDAKLFLDWGSTITGASAGWSEQLPPGVPVSGFEEWFPGDRIIAQNGGVITTDIPEHFTPGVDPVVNISSGSGGQWSGITIQNPTDASPYWFVNCNISDMCDLVMRGSVRPFASINFFKTNFHENVQLLVRDRHNLSIDDCDFIDNYFGINVYNSPATIVNSTITGNGIGLNMNYACTEESVIENCDINNNDGNGLRFRDRDIRFLQNNVQNNLYHGIVAYSGGAFALFEDNDVSNNGWSEYGGYEESYTWANNNNTIADAGYVHNVDKYILKLFGGWVQGDDQVDVSGNDIYHGDIERFFPTIDAFYFGGIVSDEKMMFDSASEDMNAGDYATARSTFEQLIIDYPESVEAAASLQKIYFIENYTNQNYDALLLYIESIPAEEGSTMHRVKRDLITKTYMQKEEYDTAINLLETVIADPADEIELIDALTDEAYCYVKLVVEGSRALPEICTFKPQNFNEFQQIVSELENRLYETEDPIEEDIIPVNVTLSNYPNPFNPTTTISFSLPEDGNVELSIYNVKGQKVKTLTNEFLVKGLHSIEWNGKDNNNKSVSSGIYFYKISAGKSTSMKKMLLLK